NASLVVNGKHVAEGTPAEPIRIESAGCGGSQEGIVLGGSGAGTRLVSCTIRGLTGGQGRSAGVTIDGPSVLISGSTVTGPEGSLAIEVRGGGGLSLEDSTLKEAGRGVRITNGN